MTYVKDGVSLLDFLNFPLRELPLTWRSEEKTARSSEDSITCFPSDLCLGLYLTLSSRSHLLAVIDTKVEVLHIAYYRLIVVRPG
jgi:hypothetical protein